MSINVFDSVAERSRAGRSIVWKRFCDVNNKIRFYSFCKMIEIRRVKASNHQLCCSPEKLIPLPAYNPSPTIYTLAVPCRAFQQVFRASLLAWSSIQRTSNRRFEQLKNNPKWLHNRTTAENFSVRLTLSCRLGSIPLNS